MKKKFFPFDDVNAIHDIGELLESLDLSKARSALLWQLLRRFEIQLWFMEDTGGRFPRIEIATFWDMNHVASMPLIELLEHLVTFDNDLGREKEIAALSKLKSVIEQAIASRQQRPQNDAEAAE
jgi:hypothetical protein